MKTYSLQVLLICFIVSVSWYSCKQDALALPGKISDLHHKSVGSGSPIIVIHGGPGLGSSYMEPHLKDLSNTHEVIFYDQRNSGRSPLTIDPDRVRLQAFIDDIESLRIHYELEKVAILGHSWGGILAMKYALDYPDNTSALILIGSNAASAEVNKKVNDKLANSFSADDLEARTQIMRTEAFRQKNPMAYEELMLMGFSYQFSNRNLLDRLDLALPDDFALKSQQLANLYTDLADYDFTDQLTNIQSPTLLLYGLDDPMTPLALNSMGQKFQHATIKAIDDAGHFPFIEKKKETLETINTFLQ